MRDTERAWEAIERAAEEDDDELLRRRIREWLLAGPDNLGRAMRGVPVLSSRYGRSERGKKALRASIEGILNSFGDIILPAE